jgi:hypothetical protein
VLVVGEASGHVGLQDWAHEWTGHASRKDTANAFLDVPGRTERSALSQLEAAKLLGVRRRAFRGWRDRHREEGEGGLLDHRLHPSPRRAPVREIERLLGLYRELYRGFTVKHFHSRLGRRHNYRLAPGPDPLCAGVCIGTEQEQSGQITSYQNPTD